MSLMKCSTKKPGSKSPLSMRGARTSSALLPAAPVLTDFRTVAREADDGEDHVGALGDAARRVGPGGAGVEQRPGLVLRAVVDRRLVAPGQDVLAHPAPHDAGTDPADARLARFRPADGH